MPADRTATRRDFLRATAAGAAGLAIPGLASGGYQPAGSGRATSCIFINLVGGPSHLDTFDPKPDAPAEVRGPFGTIPTRTPGVRLSELFPKLAAVSDQFSLIRGMHHDGPPVHEAGLQLLNTGRLFRDGPEWPSVGAVVAHLRLAAGQDARHLVIPTRELQTGIHVGQGFAPGCLPVRSDVWPRAGRQTAISDTFYPAFGKTRFGEDCQWAYLWSGADAPVVTVNMYPGVFDAVSWDCHAAGGSLATTLADYRDEVAPTFDAGLSGLLHYLEQAGRLDSTLVVATGEFGRTPYLNGSGGRDHWANCWTAIVAGGGTQGGRVIGASDRLGGEPKDRPVTPPELVSTVFHALGVPADATIPGPAGSPVVVYPGRPVLELL